MKKEKETTKKKTSKKTEKNELNLIFLDTETSGLEKADRLCQLAYKVGDVVCNEFFNPGVPINLQAMSVHHITEDQVKDKPFFRETEHYKTLQELLAKENSIFVAHNAKFDIGMVEREGIKVDRWICTQKVSEYLFSDDDSVQRVNLQYLRYYFGITIPDAVAHDALGDIIILEMVFEKLYDIAVKKSKGKVTREKILQRMMDISMKPQVMKKMPFGKFKGYDITTVAKADKGYLTWLLGNKEFEPNDSLKYSIELALGIK